MKELKKDNNLIINNPSVAVPGPNENEETSLETKDESQDMNPEEDTSTDAMCQGSIKCQRSNACAWEAPQ